MGAELRKEVVADEALAARQPRRSTAFTDVDLGREGKQVGAFFIPHSPHEDAWGATRVPLAVIRNGRGPTVLIEAGNHGDEYEGLIALAELVRELDPAEVSGCVIAVPGVNAPAVDAARRTSPVDGINFNRAFPGDPAGSLTQQIAAYMHDVLFPQADYFLDLHSGGSSLMIAPSAIIEPGRNREHHRRNVEATIAFGAPRAVMVDNLGEARTATASANDAGITVVGNEMAGAGTVTREALDICRRGIRNVLAHAEVIDPARLVRSPEPCRTYHVPGSHAYVLAEDDGAFEPFHEVGAAVEEGQEAGLIHFLADPARAPKLLRYRASGILFAKRQPARVRPGNCCVVVAAPYEAGTA